MLLTVSAQEQVGVNIDPRSLCYKSHLFIHSALEASGGELVPRSEGAASNSRPEASAAWRGLTWHPPGLRMTFCLAKVGILHV